MEDALGDLYALLGVSPNASQDHIHAAFRSAAKRYHPDENPSPAATALFRQISAAYRVLNDPAKRADYDRVLFDNPIEPVLDPVVLQSRQIVPRLSEPQLVYAMLTLSPPVTPRVEGGHAPLNLALVIDRSTSMNGPRLDQVKAATNHIIDNLAQEDVVSVVSFSDRCEVVIRATHPHDRRTMKATVSTMRADGATAMYEGLVGGMNELGQNLHPRYINHVMLITDGHTYGDEDACLQLADKAREQGVGISAMGIGEDWNDVFLDELVSRTGGSSEYVASHRAVTAFLEERIRSLGTAYADNARVFVAPSPQATLDTIFKVSPDPMPLSADPQPIPLGMLDAHIPTSLIAQFSLTIEPDTSQEHTLGQILVYADVLGSPSTESAIVDVTVEIGDQPVDQVIPTDLLNALSRLSLFQLQERARQAIDSGNPVEASRRLELLATRLFEQGEEDLARAAMAEAQRVSTTKFISGEGRKKLKYGTRGLVYPKGSMG